MGGNLFTKGNRLSRDKYLLLEKDVKNYLNKDIGLNLYRIPRYYNTKPDFGDMDILVSSDLFNINKINQISFKDRLINELDIKKYQQQNGILHTLYKGFQVDFFPTNPNKLDTISSFMDYNIGNFIGKIARKFNLKYGMDGLSYIYRGDDNHFKRELFISNDMKKIFELLDLDYNIWKKGFNDKIDSYNWIISSKYFCTHTYYNPKGGTKKRANDRTEFSSFINWLKETNNNKEFTFISDEGKFDTIKHIFPYIDIDKFIKESKSTYDNIKKVKCKFNAEIINNIYPNLKGKQLGLFIRGFRKYITDNYGEFDNYILYISSEKINLLIKQYYNRF
jgi:hypothetical protein